MLRIAIQTRVIILVCVAALPLLLIAVYNARHTERAELEHAHRETLVLARTLAALQADVLTNTRQLLFGLAAGYEGSRDALFGPACESTLRRTLEGSPLHYNVAAADPRGRVRCSALPVKQEVSIGDRQYFKDALSARAFTISHVITDRISGKSAIIAAQPVHDPFGPIAAVLLAAFETKLLSEAFERVALPADVVATLVDINGRVLARRPYVREYIGTIFEGFHRLGPQAIAREQGVATLVGLDGVRRVAGYARLAGAPGVPLYVVAGVPEMRIHGEASRNLWRNLGALAVALAVALAMGFAGAYRLIVRPLRELTAAAERYRRGDLSARSGLDHEAGEIGNLAGTFDALAGNNQRITRALRALSAGNRTVLREKDEASLLNAMCRVAVEEAGYRVAFVSYAQHDERKSVRAVARAGDDQGFIDSLDLTWADSERGRATVGPAIRTATTAIIRSMPTDPRFAPWREAAVSRRFGSVASFPLVVDDAVLGTFTLIASEEGAFDAREIELLEEMAADLAFGVEALRSATRRASAEEAARRAITHDSLTGLPGRIVFLRALEQAVCRAGETGDAFAVMVVNLSNLPDLHDGLGHDAVNAAVMEAASRLKFAMSPAGLLARLSADDFGLLLARGTVADAEDLGRRFQGLFEAPLDTGGIQIAMRISVGVSRFPVHGDGADMLVRRASIAAREATRKELGFYLYSGATERENPERLELAARLREAIAHQQLVLHFQPKVELASGQARAAEALVRWQHPEKGMIAPMQFVSIAEHTGLIRPMTRLVIELAVQQLHAWRGRPVQIPIAINLSPRNLHDPRLLAQIEDALQRWSVPAALLEFEITESALAEDPEAARDVLQRLRALGFKLYIDDFGTGYSSLSYLVSLPVQALKIDRSFVRQMTRRREARAVVSSIISMAKELGLETVAEGVETREDADMLRELGCQEAQGYFFGRPVAAEDFGAARR